MASRDSISLDDLHAIEDVFEVHTIQCFFSRSTDQ